MRVEASATVPTALEESRLASLMSSPAGARGTSWGPTNHADDLPDASRQGRCLGLSGIVAGVAPHASAQEVLSVGCAFLNSASFDVENAGGESDLRDFVAGEVITVRTGEPAGGGAPEDTFLFINNDVVSSSAGFPVSLSYTVPADGEYSVKWEVINGAVTWNVSCTAARPDADGDGVPDTIVEPPLAETGASTAPIGMLAAALVVGGASALLVVNRGRRRI